MRVALFFDGKNFYCAMQDADPTLQVDYQKLATIVTRHVAGETGRFVGARYYTGFSYSKRTGTSPSGAGKSFDNFLSTLARERGFFVRREPRVARTHRCSLCKKSSRYWTEKRVDSRLVAEMIQLAAVDAFDIAVLFSGDQDLLPAVEAVAALGKQVWVATWGGRGLSAALRDACFGEMNLKLAAEAIRTSRPRSKVPTRAVVVNAEATSVAVPSDVAVALADTAESAGDPSVALTDGASTPIDLAQVASAVQRMASAFTQSKSPYASRWYFENKWKDQYLPSEPAIRHTAVQKAIDAGLVQEYEVVDKKGRPDKALRPGTTTSYSKSEMTA
jgi:uncharacterized LabA/DUF88 family protein